MTKSVIVVLAALAAGTTVVTRAAPAPRVDTSRQLRLARDLAREPSAQAGFVGVVRSERAWSEAERRAARIPLPTGGNFNGITWTTQRQLSTAQIEQILEYNALCQWLRARRDARERGLSQEVLSSVPSWPAMRVRPRVVAAVVAATDPPLLRGVLDDCERSHAREVAVARRTRLDPPR